MFKIKKNAAGEIDKYKAQLVVRSFTQVHDVNYYDTYTPVARLTSLCLILAIAACHDWEIDIFNFHSTFLNGKLNDDKIIFMELLPGYNKSGSNVVARL